MLRKNQNEVKLLTKFFEYNFLYEIIDELYMAEKIKLVQLYNQSKVYMKMCKKT